MSKDAWALARVAIDCGHCGEVPSRLAVHAFADLRHAEHAPREANVGSIVEPCHCGMVLGVGLAADAFAFVRRAMHAHGKPLVSWSLVGASDCRDIWLIRLRLDRIIWHGLSPVCVIGLSSSRSYWSVKPTVLARLHA